MTTHVLISIRKALKLSSVNLAKESHELLKFQAIVSKFCELRASAVKFEISMRQITPFLV